MLLKMVVVITSSSDRIVLSRVRTHTREYHIVSLSAAEDAIKT